MHYFMSLNILIFNKISHFLKITSIFSKLHLKIVKNRVIIYKVSNNTFKQISTLSKSYSVS